MSTLLSTQQVLQKLKDGEALELCDIVAAGAYEGQQGKEARLAALIAWVTNAAGSDSADALLTQIRDNFSATINSQSRQLVEPLGMPTVARQLAAGAASANTALTATCRRISIRAIGAAIRFAIGSTSQTADGATSHFIADGERLDFAVPATPNIAVIRDATTDGVLELTELA